MNQTRGFISETEDFESQIESQNESQIETQQPRKKNGENEENLFFCEKCKNWMFLSDKYELPKHQKRAKCKKLHQYWQNKGLAGKNSSLEDVAEEILVNFQFETALTFIMGIYDKDQSDLLSFCTIPMTDGNGDYTMALALRICNFMVKTKSTVQKMELMLPEFFKIFFDFSIDFSLPSARTISRMFNAFGIIRYDWMRFQLDSSLVNLIIDGGTKNHKKYLSILISFFKHLDSNELKIKKKKLEKMLDNQNDGGRKLRLQRKIILEGKPEVLMLDELELEDSTASNMKKEIESSFGKLAIPIERIRTVTSDNASNNNLMCDLFDVERLACGFHVLNLLDSKAAWKLFNNLNLKQKQITKNINNSSIDAQNQITKNNNSQNNTIPQNNSTNDDSGVSSSNETLQENEELVTKQQEKKKKNKNYATLEFFKSLRYIASFLDENWDYVQLLLKIEQEDKIKVFELDDSNTQKQLEQLSLNPIPKPIFGQFHRFHSFLDFVDWLYEDLNNIKSTLDFMSQIKLGMKDGNMNCFFERREEIAAFQNIFVLNKDLYDLCYKNKGFAIEYLFEVLRSLLKKYEDLESCDDNSFLTLIAPSFKNEIKENNNVNLQVWRNKFQKVGKSLKKKCLKHYKPILESSFWNWSELGNENTYKSLCQKKYREIVVEKKEDPFEDWVLDNLSFFQNPQNLFNQTKLMKKWADVFAGINVTELWAESAVKHLKLYVQSKHKKKTISNVVSSFLNGKTPIPDSPEMIEKMKETYKNVLKKEREDYNAKKAKSYIDDDLMKKFKRIKGFVEQLKAKKTRSKKKEDTEEENFVWSLIWELKRNDFSFQYKGESLSKTNIDRLISCLGFQPPKEWTINQKIQAIYELKDLNPLDWLKQNVFNNSASYEPDDIPTPKDWGLKVLVDVFKKRREIYEQQNSIDVDKMDVEKENNENSVSEMEVENENNENSEEKEENPLQEEDLLCDENMF